jgi:hypothetical protein
MPKLEQNKLKNVYRTHVLIVTLFFISVSGVIGCAALFPVYVQVSNEVRSMSKVSKDATLSTKISTIQTELENHKKLMAALNQPAEVPLSTRIQNIVALRGVTTISSILIERTSTTSVTSVIQGKAPTRDSLIALKKRLEDIGPGTKVELPNSDLTKKTDISYSIRITQ